MSDLRWSLASTRVAYTNLLSANLLLRPSLCVQGMWAEPDNMRGLLRTKGAQLQAGSSTAWVPSPTAATLHALHYLQTSVVDVQSAMAAAHELEGEMCPYLDDLLTPPLMSPTERAALKPSDIQRELESNVQSLLGYVVRWVGQGVGCSKVPDLDGVQLMEDRATLRISSQHIANWLHHGASAMRPRSLAELGVSRRVTLSVTLSEPHAERAAS
mmetsp:Transcript_20695/g.52731  ORF Transcript_20695/g.52731 Transcript_20695/m.52731 type:complete len:214 (-) Transcript_20695:593-1234(-)